MINTLKIYNELSQTMDSPAAQKIAEIIGIVYEELQNMVTKADFNELKGVVKELAEAQRELAEAQRKTEARVEELAEAQRKTEQEVRTLAKTLKNLQKEVGGISNTLGYELEEKYYDIFSDILWEDFQVKLSRPIDRHYIIYPSGKEDEINIYGEGKKNGERVYIVGESKAQIGRKDVKDFNRLLYRVRGYLSGKIIPIFLCYTIHPGTQEFIRQEHSEINVYKSSELSRRKLTKR